MATYTDKYARAAYVFCVVHSWIAWTLKCDAGISGFDERHHDTCCPGGDEEGRAAVFTKSSSDQLQSADGVCTDQG